MIQILLFFTIVPLVLPAQPVVPQWAKDAVWYQIFPERFRNGDSSNDPAPSELKFPPARGWKVSPWNSDWYQLQPWEQDHNPNFYDNVFDRRYGGDLKGVLDKLDYLADLGITALYFNPIFEAASLHKYDASTYHHIDNNFGPDPEGDLAIIEAETEDPATWKWSAADRLFLNLIAEAHKRGIRIILDGVFNHSGTDFWAFRDVVENQQRSRYADWFDVRRWDDLKTPENEFEYKGWWDYQGLPEFREDSSGFVRPVWTYFFNITKRWMDPNGDGDPSDGIDGWRLDVANDVSHHFWKEWRTLVKSVNPNAYIVGEIWDDASTWLQGDEFDAVMNYRFSRAVVRFFADTDSSRYSVREFDEELADVRKGYPEEVNYILQNLIDSHDTDRWSSMILNANREYDRNNGLRHNPAYDVQKPGEREFQILRLMALFQLTYIGAPMIYYGTESGMWGADDPDDRKPMVWDDIAYDDERSHPISGKGRRPDNVAFDRGLFAYLKQVIAIRNKHDALRRGSFRTLLATDEGIYAFERAHGKELVTVILNNCDKPQRTALGGQFRYTDLLTGKNILGSDIWLPARSGMVLVPSR
ncbi:MAG: glycoside hydrolase family 13 protein [Bacteroidota bacterium]